MTDVTFMVSLCYLGDLVWLACHSLCVKLRDMVEIGALLIGVHESLGVYI